ncbi:MAG: MerR family DNA-binding transcriptional regulator [Sulfuritalea sp.]|nr:MerR family DNA-binding transcriptional regulator [Sulfuritalea sp.]MDP1980959.1 MerR family DNA-binding transcriptional regulator [Sulfuritalea sp.]
MNRTATRKTASASVAPAPTEGELYGITELAQECGISLRAIRFYEDKGLLAPRRINGGRAYTRRDRVRLGLILRGKAVGMSLAEIEHILSLYGDHGEGHAQQLEYLVGRIDAAMTELETRRSNIEAMLGELGAVRAQLKKTLAAKRRVKKK